MRRRTFIQLGAATGAVAVLGLGGTISVSASPAAAGGVRTKYKLDPKNRKRTTAAMRKAAAQRTLAARQAAGVASVTLVPNAANVLVPDYFGTTPNYANTPVIRKFVDGLPGLNAAGANNLGQYIPVAIADTTTYPGCDYYEIELNQYTEKMHSDLPLTTLRGYRQTNTTDPTVSVFHNLGPLILAQTNRPVRVKFTNNLPTGTGGNLFIPCDTTYMGAGMGPNGMNVGAGHPVNYSQNRATLHLHGGNTPWISDGTTHQWTTPAAEPTDYPRGVSVSFVPDMWFDPTTHATVPAGTAGAVNDPGPGSLTFYYTNQQSARLMFYHDHAYGITRLNVYAGEAAGYLLTDQAELDLMNGTNVSGLWSRTTLTPAAVLPATQIPLIIQDKTFVDAALIGTQDPTWVDVNQPTFGTTPGAAHAGDLWFPHVYMTNQNPYDISGANACGRWDYGPWFWPPFTGLAFETIPNPYASVPGEPPVIPGIPLPSGVPEGFMDTPVVNGTAYPTLTVDPQPTRFRILNACNDRNLNLQLYVATGIVSGFTITAAGTGYDPLNAPAVTISGTVGKGATAQAVVDPTTGAITAIAVMTVGSGYVSTTPPTVTIDLPPAGGTPASATAVIYDTAMTEVGMIPANAGAWPAGWPTPDGRAGGFPDPAKMGPNFIQIGNEGGILVNPVVIPNRPVGYDYNRRSITVLNVLEQALFMGPAERADVLVDFTKFAGQTVILYNDAPAPVPAFDPRIDYFTNDGDQTSTGGAPNTLPGFGPNTRTIMQIKVNATVLGAAAPALNLATLQAVIPAAFGVSQEQPIVPQVAYNTAFGASYPKDNYPTTQEWVRISDTSVNVANGSVALTLTNGGAGYTAAPAVTISPAPLGGVNATAVANLPARAVGSLALSSGGLGYTSAPTVSLAGGGGSGATATAALSTFGSVKSVAVTASGSGYTTVPTVTIAGGGGSGATATATVTNRRVSAITVTNPGSGFTSRPTVTITGGGGSGATAAATLGFPVLSLTLSNGGSNYTSAPTVSFSGGAGSGAAATAALLPTPVGSLTLTNAGAGYLTAPTVSIAPPQGTGTTAVATAALGTVNMKVKPKAIQELFTLDYGRMNATLGVEIPNTTGINQTTIPLGYVDPPTELVSTTTGAALLGAASDGSQIWKITHNGVDTHTIHFHLFNVQVVNRVGWDGAVKPPLPNEIGWKESVRMHPLEDCIVACRPRHQDLPFELPNSYRTMDVTEPVGATSISLGTQPNFSLFTNVDPTGQPATVSNAKINFGYEYVWHCHLLGHEENDMMRPILFLVPPKQAPVLAGPVNVKGGIQFTWTEASPNWTSFTLQRASAAAPTVFTDVVTVTTLTATDTSKLAKGAYIYQVVANNTAGYLQTYAPPAAGYPSMTVRSAPSNSQNVTI